ncbi:MAG TPA: hypothetical protein VFX05_09615, partial [Casimicrobiaceae bacterium]|nr:hypothetical protein [Casimicrobiaceae bacterium]
VLRGLFANLAAGLRLALLLPVERQRFRLDAAQVVVLTLFSALVDIGADWLRYGPDVVLDIAGAGSELTGLAILVLIAALLAWAFRDALLVVALSVVVLASLPAIQLANVLPVLLAADEARAPWVADAVHIVLLVWFLATLGRSAFVALAPHRRRLARALAALLLLATPLLIPPGVLPEAPWWSTADGDAALDPTNPAAEPILALQRELQDEALGALDEHAQGETDLYFVAFAPDGAGDTWGARMETARKMMDGHWGTEGRSLVYVNDASRLTEAPIASVTHLREALEEIAAASNPDEDVVMLYLAGRSNADGSMSVSLPPLGLVQLSGPGLASLLKQAGIRWRVVVVATCAPQPFIDALADAQTLVMAAAGGGERAAGCANQGEPTALGDALFGEALATASSLPAAFARAHKALAAQGPEPVIHVGEEIAAQLSRLRTAPGGRAGLERAPRG